MANTIGFGQAAVNNTIDYGKGATDNTINWGKSQTLSPSGETNITGGGGTPSFSNVNSFSFDGVDDYFLGTSTYSELDGQSKMTLSMWVKPSASGISQILTSTIRNATSNNFQHLMRTDTNERIRFFKSTTSDYTYSNANVLNIGQWNHVVVCVDLSQSTTSLRCRIFVNNVDETSGFVNLSTTAFDASIDSLYIGENQNGDFTPFLGKIDELAIWSGTDLRNDVATIYNNGEPTDLNNNGLTAPTTWQRMGENATWNGATWTMTDVNGGYTNRSINMVEANRTTDVPTASSFSNTKSIALDGVDDYVEIGSPTSIQNLTSEITISAWIKAPRRFTTNYYTLASKGEYAASGSQWSIRINTANARNTAGGLFSVYPNSNAITDRQSVAFPTPVDDDQWHHVMFVNDGTDLKVYIDGVLDVTGTGKGRTLYNGNRTLRLGRLTASTTQKLIGNLDEVAIFSTALGLSDAQTIWNGGSPSSLSSYSSLVSWWRCGDGDTSPTLTDNGSGGNDGTMTNFTTFSTDVPT